MVHVVQDSEVRGPQKYPAPLTITVSHGSLRSTENPIRPASICKAAGRGVGPLLFAKVRVAGSNPVVHSKKVLVTAVSGTRMGPSKGGWYHIRTTFFGVLCPSDR